MNTEPYTCLRCNVQMENGILIDMADGAGVRISQWTRGSPSSGGWDRFLGREMSAEQVRAAVKVIAHRCPSCGMLELHAPDSTR